MKGCKELSLPYGRSHSNPPASRLVGWHGVPPTGKQVNVTGVAIDRISNGKITEHFGVHDSLGFCALIASSAMRLIAKGDAPTYHGC